MCPTARLLWQWLLGTDAFAWGAVDHGDGGRGGREGSGVPSCVLDVDYPPSVSLFDSSERSEEVDHGGRGRFPSGHMGPRVIFRRLPDGSVTEPWGAHPVGRITYDSDGT